MIAIREYIDSGGRNPYARWFNRLDAQAAAKVATALVRLGMGNLSGVKGVDAGVFEHRIDFGPGYRIYFGKDGETLIIPFWWRHQEAPAAGHRNHTKSLQDYKRRKRQEA